ncbi:Zinc-finger homeodomain protein 1 [Capsicum annuum]|uniref:zinc-finger homeodomain protein 2 n=1 Tax=Capsicum annuum TaxID=4072 RepID=UPI0007BF8A2B|nr:zinc-finger homeodomain protein 2 [Capsicum annuum]KAF3615633.1 Zinc-finger homeodomain protein 1 [Capsicum annuum]
MEYEDQQKQREEPSPNYPTTTTKMSPSPQLQLEPVQLEPVQLWTGSSTATKPKYKECLKNHAVSIGGHAVDGCGEFLPSGEDGSIDSLKCAACNCHRNFHRKITQPPSFTAGSGGGEPGPFVYYRSIPPPPPPPYGYLQYHVATHQRPLALPSTSGGGYREDQEDIYNPNYSGGSGAKKRFRTKFSQEQKDKMQEVADKLGWRIQREDEDLVQQLCNETGLTRQVFKVWMHNNKHTLGKKT